MKRILCLSLLTSALFLLPNTAHATLLRGLSLDELCQRSGVIVRGKVVSRASAWKGGRIYTRVTMRVSTSLRGSHQQGTTVSFWRLGGKVGRYVQLIRGTPRFSPGDRVLVFLSQRGTRLFVTGMAQGRFAIRQATTTTAATVSQSLSGARLLGKKRALRRPTSLAGFEKRIRATLIRIKARTP